MENKRWLTISEFTDWIRGILETDRENARSVQVNEGGPETSTDMISVHENVDTHTITIWLRNSQVFQLKATRKRI